MPDRKFIEIKVSTGNSKQQVDSLDKSMIGLGKSSDKTAESLGSLSKAAIAVASAISVQQVIAFADAWTTVNNKLANSIRANETLADVTQRVFDIAQNTRSSLDATASLYARLERATRDYGTSAEDVARLTRTINQGFIVSGATAQEAENAVIQLSQGLASGALRGEEFNSVNEQGNRLIVALADSLGKTTGEMRALAAAGALTTDVVVNGLLKQSSVIENEYSKTIATFAQQTQVATQNLTKFIGESTTVQGVVAVAGDAIVTASESLQFMTDVTVALAAVYVARLTPAVGAYVASMYASVAAQLTATRQVTGLSAALGVQAASLTRATIAQNAYNIAARAGAGALALFGGPAGVAVLAASAIAYYYATAETAEQKTKRLSEEVDTLAESFKGLTRAQREVEIAKLNTEMASVRQELIKANEALNNWTETAKRDPFANQQVRVYKNRVEELNATLDELSQKQQAIFQSGLPATTNTTGTTGGATPSVGGSATGTPNLPNADYSARYIAGEVASTEALAQELQNRVVLFEQFTTQINAIQDDTFAKEKLRLEATEFEQISSANLQLQNRLSAIEQERALLLENDSLTFEARTELALQFDEQEIIARQTHEQTLTEVSEEGAEARRRIAEAERNFNIGLAAGAFNDLLGLAQGHSRKAFELAKAGAIGTAVIKGYDAAVAAWDAGMSTGGPWAPAVAAAYTAASLLKTGSLIKGISGAKYGSGSQTAGTGGGSTPAPSTGGVASSPGQTGNLRAPTQIFDLRGITADSLVTGQALIDILNATPGVAVAIDGVMQEGRRLGEIS